MADTIQFRRGTAAQWMAADPLLAAGEPGYEADTGRHKIGNGQHRWSDLPYYVDETEIGPDERSGLLASRMYEPPDNTVLSTSSRTPVAVDSDNLTFPAFRAPVSGIVFVRFSALCYSSTPGSPIMWSVQDESGAVAHSEQIATQAGVESASRVTWVRKMPVSPGATIRGWAWAWRVINTNRSGYLEVGSGSPAPGAALMEVYETPL